MVFGVMLMIGAITLMLSNSQEAARAEQSVEEYLPQLIAQIEKNEQIIVSGGSLSWLEPDVQTGQEPQSGNALTDEAQSEDVSANSGDDRVPAQSSPNTGSVSHDASSMTQVVIKQYSYIGYLTIPKLRLELPIMTDWSYEHLKISPCRYSGSVMGDDLVLMAHNYARHFGKLSELSTGDEVYFTDVLGITTRYQVVGRDVLDPYAVGEMTSGEFDLTLFTCTYGGQSRVTVYCDKVVS